MLRRCGSGCFKKFLKKSSPTSYDWDSNRKATNVKRFTLCMILPVLVLISSCPAFTSNPEAYPTSHFVAIATTPFKDFGYWAVQSNGKVYNYGCAFFGDASHRHLTQPVVGIAPANNGQGYWLLLPAVKSSLTAMPDFTARLELQAIITNRQHGHHQ